MDLSVVYIYITEPDGPADAERETTMTTRRTPYTLFINGLVRGSFATLDAAMDAAIIADDGINVVEICKRARGGVFEVVFNVADAYVSDHS